MGYSVPLKESFLHRRQAVALAGGFRACHQAFPCREYGRSRSPLAISHRLGINPPSVAQRLNSAESMSVTEPARNFLRRPFCAARGDEFFLYEKMGRRAIDHAGSTSEAGGRAQAPVPTPPKKWESKGTQLRIRRSRIPRRVVSRRTAERESRALAAFPRCKSALRGHLTFIIVYEWGVICKCSSLK